LRIGIAASGLWASQPPIGAGICPAITVWPRVSGRRARRIQGPPIGGGEGPLHHPSGGPPPPTRCWGRIWARAAQRSSPASGGGGPLAVEGVRRVAAASGASDPEAP